MPLGQTWHIAEADSWPTTYQDRRTLCGLLFQAPIDTVELADPRPDGEWCQHCRATEARRAARDEPTPPGLLEARVAREATPLG